MCVCACADRSAATGDLRCKSHHCGSTAAFARLPTRTSSTLPRLGYPPFLSGCVPVDSTRKDDCMRSGCVRIANGIVYDPFACVSFVRPVDSATAGAGDTSCKFG